MKHIIKLNANKYIQLDSYGSTFDFVGNVLVASFITVITAVTACAAVGVDISSLIAIPTVTQQSK